MNLISGLQNFDVRSYVNQIGWLFAWLFLLMAVFVPLERLFAIHPWKVRRKNFWSDIGYYFLSSIFPKFLLAAPLSVVAWTAHRIVPYHVHLAAAYLPFWARMAALVLVLEIGFYWGHRWSHAIPFLWRFHAVHHSAEAVDWLTNTRVHPVDMVFTRLCGFIPVYILGLVQPAGSAAYVPPIAVIVIGTMWGYFIHANVRWRFGWLERFVSTPAFHHWHHTNDEHRDRNFAPLFSWVDILFGTFYLPRRSWPSQYGIDVAISTTMTGQLLDPLIGAIPLKSQTAAGVNSTDKAAVIRS